MLLLGMVLVNISCRAEKVMAGKNARLVELFQLCYWGKVGVVGRELWLLF